MTEQTYTYRQWLTTQLLLAGSDIFTATEAVASTALEHPEWNLDEKRTWEEWEVTDD
jgi:hypothetical protein